MTKYKVAGVIPDRRFWVVIWATLQGTGGSPQTYWMSVSDLDADADTDNEATDNPRTPSELENEDLAEYPGYQAPPTVPGLLLGINDDHDEFLPAGQPWGRDYDDTEAALESGTTDFKDGTNYDGHSVGLAQIKVKLGVKRAPGQLTFTLPNDDKIRLFEGEEPIATKKGKTFEGDRTIGTPGEKTFIFYAEGRSPISIPGELTITYNPDGGEGEAIDTVRVLPVGMDIDVDSDNSGAVDGSDDEDQQEAQLGITGMLVPVSDDPDDGKAGVLRGLHSQTIASLLDDQDAVVKLKAISGSSGDARVWRCEQGKNPVLLLDTSVSECTIEDGEGGSLFDLLADLSDHEIVVTGVSSGEVLLGLELVVNVGFDPMDGGTKVVMDLVRITVVDIDLDVDSDNDNDIDDDDDPIEMSKGGIVLVNTDDDNGNGTPDGGESGTVAGENDLEPIKLSPAPDASYGGTLTLSAVSGGSKIKIWESAAKGTQIPLPKTWTVGVDTIPQTLYVEAISASGALRDIELRLRYVRGQTQFDDQIALTAVLLDLTIYNGGADLDNGEAVGPDGGVVAADKEETEGAYLLVNWDDDDADGQMNANGTFSQPPVPDLTETSVNNEDNLAKLLPYMTPSALDVGTVELEVTNGANRMKLWTQKTKGTEITLAGSKKTWNLSNSSERSDFASACQNGLWIEGIEASSAERDVTIVLRYNGQAAGGDAVNATVVMINLADAVYRDADLPLADDTRGHAALVTRFIGPCTKAALIDDAKFGITDARGAGISDTWLLTNITSLPGYPCRGCFTNTTITYVQRLRVLATVKAMVNRTPAITYRWEDAVTPDDWNGRLDTISTLRCDSTVEVCYEMNGVMAWAMKRDPDGTYNYDITNQSDNWDYSPTSGTWSPGANNKPDNLEEHNDLDKTGWTDTLMPATQAGYVTPQDARTTFTRHNLCEPVGSKGGNP